MRFHCFWRAPAHLWTPVLCAALLVSPALADVGSPADFREYYELEAKIEKLRKEYALEHKSGYKPTLVKAQALAALEKRLKSIGDALDVKVWTGALTTVDMSLTQAKNEGIPCERDREGVPVFFKDSWAHSAWNTWGDLWMKYWDPIDRKTAYYARDDGPVHHCLKDRTISIGKSATVSRKAPKVCKYVFGPIAVEQSSSVRYRIVKEKDWISVSMNIYFTYKGLPLNKTASVARLREVLPCVQGIYAKQGIRLRLNIVEDYVGRHDPEQLDQSIELWDHFNRSTSSQWTTLSSSKAAVSAGHVCGIYAHEIGHLLGLDDRYADADCPDRGDVANEKDRLMAHSGAGEFGNFYPEELARILAPVCNH